MHYW